MSRRVCVTGGRTFGDKALVFATLDRLHAEEPILVIVQGGAKGADALARAWAVSRGIDCVEFPANWIEGPSAGPRRNKRMAAALTPGRDLLVAFSGARGTADMARQTRARGVAVTEPCSATSGTGVGFGLVRCLLQRGHVGEHRHDCAAFSTAWAVTVRP